MDTIEKRCQKCGTTFHVNEEQIAWFAIRHCPTCSQELETARGAAALARKESERLEDWRRLCPKAFLETDREKLPNPGKLDEVLEWQYSPRGLMLHGPTGRGKSRCAWSLLRREYLGDLRKRVIALNALSGIEYAALFSSGAEYVKEWIDSLCRCHILFMDDIFKAKFTDSFEGAMFGVITVRTENALPVIITCNDTGASLAARLTGDRGEPMIRRLREHCTCIQF